MFPREQVLVVKLEEYSKDPASAMDNIFRFLDLSKFLYSILSVRVPYISLNQGLQYTVFRFDIYITVLSSTVKI